jgi:hypothetical protein
MHGMDEPQNTRRHSVFTVWRWPRWTWAVIIPVLVVCYPLIVGPFVWMVDRGYLLY